jgi:hypothetical protein
MGSMVVVVPPSVAAPEHASQTGSPLLEAPRPFELLGGSMNDLDFSDLVEDPTPILLVPTQDLSFEAQVAAQLDAMEELPQ